MKATTLVAILSSFHSSVHATVTTSDNDVILHRRESTQSLIDSYAGQGLCLSYAAEQNREAMLAPCKIWCPKQSPENDPEAVGCKGPTVDRSKVPRLVDGEGLEYTPGECICDLEIAEAILDIVIEGLGQIDKVLCSTMLSALTTAAEIALTGIFPAGAAAKAAVRGAKTFAENGLDAVSFGGWVGSACGLPDFHFDIFDAFTGLVGLPDSEGTSKGCLRKNKATCKKPEPRPDPPPKPDAPKPEPPKPEPPKPPLVSVPGQVKPTLPKSPLPSPSSPVSIPGLPQPGGPPVVFQPPRPANPPVNPPTNPNQPPANPTKPTGTGPATDKPASTRPASTASSSAAVCRLGKRAPRADGLVQGELGKDISSEECDARGQKTMHITKTPNFKAGVDKYTETINMKCPRQFAQACYHYRSVMFVHAGNKDMTEWTCHETVSNVRDKNNNLKATALTDWGSTALAQRAAKWQHWWPWANGFVYRTTRTGADGRETSAGCERDEWPPAAFWPGDELAAKKKMSQRIRFIPREDNGGAGRIWRGFCETHNAQTVEGKETFINPKYIRTQGKARVDPARRGADGVTTIISTVDVRTAHAIFSFGDFDSLPTDPFDGLKLNPCWPSLLAPSDPGWALLTNDEFYLNQHPLSAQHTHSYAALPDLNSVWKALTLDANGVYQPPFQYSSLADFAAVQAEFRGGHAIPAGYLGVLPGIPKDPGAPVPVNPFAGGGVPGGPVVLPPLRPAVRRGVVGNETERGWGDDGAGGDYYGDAAAGEGHGHGGDGGVDLEEYDDAELDAWIERYMAWVKSRQQSSNTVAPRNDDARATPVGEGGPMPMQTPATKRTGADADMPEPTAGPRY